MIFLAGISYGQEAIPKLEVEEEYQIIGKDTRVFSIRGERISTVEYNAVPLRLVQEERTIISSEGLISEDERLRRKETFNAIKGLSAWGHYSFGAHKTNTFFGKVDYNAGTMAASMTLHNRFSEENTAQNTAPLSQVVEVNGFLDTRVADYSLSLGFSRDEDDSLSHSFRPGNHEVNRYRTLLMVKPSILESWNPVGRISVEGGTYSNYEKPSNTSTLIDENELDIDGSVSFSGKIFKFTVSGETDIEFIKLGGDSGTLFSTGGKGNWLFFNRIGVHAGANFHAYELPGETTNTKVYPEFGLDWALTPGIFLKAQFKPGIISHSFGDMFERNGLITMAVPLLFEDRSNDLSGEFGFRTQGGLSVSFGGFAFKSKHSPVFSRTGDFFEIVKNAEVELTGYRVKTEYLKKDLWGINGIVNVNNADWKFLGNVPYIPNMDAIFDGYYIPHKFWKIRTSLNYIGKHYVETNKSDSENSFVIIDLGVDREIYKQYISMYLDLRNMTNSEGSWWTGRYNVPGIGMYIGLKAHY
ncbi:hypothetical protein ACFL6H_01435 [Candidatus Latescibacterota bacterium]